MRLKPYVLLVLPESARQNALTSHLKEKFGDEYFIMPFTEPEQALAFLDSRKHIARLDLVITSHAYPYGRDFISEVKNIFPKTCFLYTGEENDMEGLMGAMGQGAHGFLLEPENDPEHYFLPLVSGVLKQASVADHMSWHKLLPGFEKSHEPEIKVIRATTQEELTACFRLRYEVWHNEFGTLPANNFLYDYDGYDPLSIHILALVDGKPAGTVRMIPCQLGSRVVLPCEDLFSLDSYRGKNIGEISRLVLKRDFRNGITGRMMIKALLACAASEGYCDFYGSANPRYKAYYEKMGMKVLQEQILDYENFGGLPAIPMTLRLSELSLEEKRSWGEPAEAISIQPAKKQTYEFA